MKQNNGTKKPNIFKRMGGALARSFSELKKVTWPTFKEVAKNTGIVLVVVVFFVVVIGGADALLQLLFNLLTGIVS